MLSGASHPAARTSFPLRLSTPILHSRSVPIDIPAKMADSRAKRFLLCAFAAVTGSCLEGIFGGVAFNPTSNRSGHAPTAIFQRAKIEMYLASVHHDVFPVRRCVHD